MPEPSPSTTAPLPATAWAGEELAVCSPISEPSGSTEASLPTTPAAKPVSASTPPAPPWRSTAAHSRTTAIPTTVTAAAALSITARCSFTAERYSATERLPTAARSGTATEVRWPSTGLSSSRKTLPMMAAEYSAVRTTVNSQFPAAREFSATPEPAAEPATFI